MTGTLPDNPYAQVQVKFLQISRNCSVLSKDHISLSTSSICCWNITNCTHLFVSDNIVCVCVCVCVCACVFVCVCEHACGWVSGFVQSRNRSAHSIHTTTRGVTCLLQRNRVLLVSLFLLVQLHCTCKKKSTEVDGQKHLTHTDMHTMKIQVQN